MKLSRTKGRAYEQLIARKLRATFPGADVRRSSQADRAANSDVVVTGSPVLERLWLELHDARRPIPQRKLEQAERDVSAIPKPGDAIGRSIGRLPVVIWHRIHERSHQVTTRLWVLDELRGVLRMTDGLAGCDSVVTLDLEDFVEILRMANSASIAPSDDVLRNPAA